MCSATGLKDHHDSTVPPIDLENVAEPQVLGPRQLIRVPQKDMALLHVHNVVAWDEARHININPRILSGAEVPFCGVVESCYAHRKPCFNVSLPQMDEFEAPMRATHRM
jgi:hypothetical protein